MKFYLKIVFAAVIILGVHGYCLANPLSDFFSIFQRDLVVNVQYGDHKNLVQGSDVYSAEDPKGPKVLIGKVKKVTLDGAGSSTVELTIDKKYREQIFETTPFVLMSGIFAENEIPFIVAFPPFSTSGNTPIESGASVQGMTFFEYKIAAAGEGLKKWMAAFQKQNDALLKKLDEYIENIDTDAFQKQMEDLAQRISKFSAEQKENFKNEVLPSLKESYDAMMEKLQKQDDAQKSKELEKQLTEIEKLINV